MLDIFLHILGGIPIAWTLLSAVGYIAYKLNFREAKTWGEGIMQILTVAFRFLYEETTGKTIPGNLVNTALFLINQEVLELVSRLERHPYDTASLTCYLPNEKGISWFDISAFGLVATYKGITNVQIKEIVSKIIQNYYWDTREAHIDIYIKVATPARLYFAIPVSEEGRKYLEQQDEFSHKGADISPTLEPLEEEIDIFGNTGGDYK